FCTIDVPRLAQLINKSNQFNLTTIRRSEAEITQLVASNDLCLSVRLEDRFGDLGLVLAVITESRDATLHIDTWVMSCRALNRRLEHLAMNELIRRAAERGFKRIAGAYIPTAKNGLCQKFYDSMGFRLINSVDGKEEYEMLVDEFQPLATSISLS